MRYDSCPSLQCIECNNICLLKWQRIGVLIHTLHCYIFYSAKNELCEQLSEANKGTELKVSM